MSREQLISPPRVFPCQISDHDHAIEFTFFANQFDVFPCLNGSGSSRTEPNRPLLGRKCGPHPRGSRRASPLARQAFVRGPGPKPPQSPDGFWGEGKGSMRFSTFTPCLRDITETFHVISIHYNDSLMRSMHSHKLKWVEKNDLGVAPPNNSTRIKMAQLTHFDPPNWSHLWAIHVGHSEGSCSYDSTEHRQSPITLSCS